MADPFGPTKWYFSQEELDQIPNRSYMSSAQELNLRQQTTHLIQDIGQKIKVTQLCINTAIVYMHRFYCFHPFKVFHRYTIAPAAIFLATKIEEEPTNWEKIIKACHQLLNRTNRDKKEPDYVALKADLIRNESVLLSTLGFDLRIEHPHIYIIKFLSTSNLPKYVAETCYTMATNSLHLTTMCLQFKPSVVACFCIHFVLTWSGNKIPASEQGKSWYQNIDESITEQLLEKMTADFLKIYKECDATLKKRVDFDIKRMKEKKCISSNNSSSSHTSTLKHPPSSSHSYQNHPHKNSTTTGNTKSNQPHDKVSNHKSILQHPSSSHSNQNHPHKNSATTSSTKSNQPHDKVSNHKSTLQHPSSSHGNQNHPQKKSTINGNAKSNHPPSASVPHDTIAAIARHSNSNLKPNCSPPYKKPSTFGQMDTKCSDSHNLAGRSWPKTTPSIPTNHRTLLHGKDSYLSHSVTNFNHKEVDCKVQPSSVTDESALISKIIKEVALQEEGKQHLNKLSNSNSVKRNCHMLSPIHSSDEDVKRGPLTKIPKMMPKNENISKISIPHLPNDCKMAASSGTQISTSSISVPHLSNLNTDSSSNVTTSIKSKSPSSTHRHHKKKKEHKEKSKHRDKNKKKHHKHKDQDREKPNSKLKLETTTTVDTTANSIPKDTASSDGNSNSF